MGLPKRTTNKKKPDADQVSASSGVARRLLPAAVAALAGFLLFFLFRPLDSSMPLAKNLETLLGDDATAAKMLGETFFSFAATQPGAGPRAEDQGGCG